MQNLYSHFFNQTVAWWSDSMSDDVIETIELKVFLKCRDQWLSKDQVYYTDELRKFKEIERIENLWIHAKNNYEIGTYLETDLKIQTKLARKFKNQAFRLSLWDRLDIKDTCPDQGD